MLIIGYFLSYNTPRVWVMGKMRAASETKSKVCANPNTNPIPNTNPKLIRNHKT